MPRVHLERSSEIAFTFTDRAGVEREVTIPAVTIGQYKRALQCEAEAPQDETPADKAERLVKQARILCGEAHAGFVDELDPEAMIEVIQALLSVYAGMDPEAVVETQRALKKKTLLQALAGLLPRAGSPSATG